MLNVVIIFHYYLDTMKNIFIIFKIYLKFVLDVVLKSNQGLQTAADFNCKFLPDFCDLNNLK